MIHRFKREKIQVTLVTIFESYSLVLGVKAERNTSLSRRNIVRETGT